MATSLGWRLWVAHGALHGVAMIPAARPLVVLWDTPRRAYVFDAHRAELLADLTIPPPPPGAPPSDAWDTFLNALRTPGGDWLPHVQAETWEVHTSHDGRLRLLQQGDHDLTAQIEGEFVRLPRDGEAPLRVAALDRDLGTAAALDAQGRLHIYQQAVYVGAFPLALEDGPALLALADAAGSVLVGSGVALRLVDLAGRVQTQATLPAPVVACSIAPNGAWIAAVTASGLHIFDAGLLPVRHAALSDLLARLDPFDAPTADAELDGAEASRAVAVAPDGTLAFAVGGVVGVTYLDALEALPQPQALL